MELLHTDGLILKTTNYKDNDVILTLFTKERGLIKAAAKGIKSYKNKLSSACRIFSFSEFVLAEGRDLYRLKDASLNHSFYNLGANIEQLAFATYFAELACYVTQEEEPNPMLLRLLLNTFHLLAHSTRDRGLIRAAFELKLLQFSGFAPEADACIACGNIDDIDFFDPNQGGIVCRECTGPGALALPEPCLIAMRYILYNEDNRIFSFTLPEQHIRTLETILERFMEYHLDKHFPSLDYLKNILGDVKN